MFKIGLIFMTLFFISCATKNEFNSEDKALGGAKDNNGCLIAAGYTFSKLKNTCLRLFEEAVALKNMQDENATSAAFVIIEGVKAELFLPEFDESLVLELKNKAFVNKEFRLEKRNDKLFLSKNAKLIYKSYN
ncbi:hypothetical protein DMB92_06460 [Campylobacter sp. MIT 99-7217]|uniref:hypothetical protein n=1 Tax=Campylobacter sp. MIT 99-7217 TaxID=535091 RepID=UPI00115945E4|nr:hypothetical protein [Campylobacter sp. MIT 99-7217]TQR31327.1 hypothetical protein DMB92_06460 [Campylobacter sp. MIT 99-7217]